MCVWAVLPTPQGLYGNIQSSHLFETRLESQENPCEDQAAAHILVFLSLISVPVVGLTCSPVSGIQWCLSCLATVEMINAKLHIDRVKHQPSGCSLNQSTQIQPSPATRQWPGTVGLGRQGMLIAVGMAEEWDDGPSLPALASTDPWRSRYQIQIHWASKVIIITPDKSHHSTGSRIL